MNNKRKIKLFEKLILEMSTLSPFGYEKKGIYNKYDDTVDWLEEYPKDFREYVLGLHRKAEEVEA